MVIFQDLSKPKIDGYCASFGKIFHKTALGETVCLGNPDSLLTGCLGFQFFDQSPFSQHIQLGYLWLLTLCSTCVTYGTPCCSIRHRGLPAQPLPSESKDLPRGGKHSKYVLLLTYLAWLQPFINNSRLIFKHFKTKDVLKMWWRT